MTFKAPETVFIGRIRIGATELLRLEDWTSRRVRVGFTVTPDAGAPSGDVVAVIFRRSPARGKGLDFREAGRATIVSAAEIARAIGVDGDAFGSVEFEGFDQIQFVNSSGVALGDASVEIREVAQPTTDATPPPSRC